MNEMKSMISKGRKINILYLSNLSKFHGGAQKSICELISHLDRSKINPYFVSIYDGEVAKFIKNLGVPYLKINEFRRKNPFPYIISQIQLINLLLRNRISIIHNNQCQDAFYTWLPAFLTNTKMIIHHRDSRALSRMDRFLVNRADCNISISSWQNDKVLNNKAIVIHNGVDLDKIDQQIEEDSTKTFNGAKISLLVGLVARIAPIKGQHIFIEAAKIVLEKHPDVQFNIYGDINTGLYNDYYLGLINKIKELGLSNKLIFRGYTNNIGDIYPQLDISVVPSLREPFGRVIIESMAFGKPVIATNIGGPLDIVTDQTGILVPVNDPLSLANAILFLADNPAIKASMGKAGRERVENYFTISMTLSKIYDVYKGLLCNRDNRYGEK